MPVSDDDILLRITPVGGAEGSRGARVFVSSTFGDMQAERDALVKTAFPEIEHRCTERDVEFSSVELRWGITDEQVSNGRVLSICLDEIERCRPYFIGLLGDYYGSLPRAVPADVVEEHPWVAEVADRSITEIEMLAILRDTESARKALFCFRSPGAAPTPDTAAGGVWTSTGAAAERLSRLKLKIRESGLQVMEYDSPAGLASQVVDRLWISIEDEFPPLQFSSRSEREAARHRIHVAQHARVYVGRRSTLDRLSAHVEGDGPPLVITGPAGIGKTALVAAWLAECRSSLAEIPTVIHCAGATPEASQWLPMLRRFVQSLALAMGVEDSPHNQDAHELLAAFPEFLRRLSRKSRVLLIVDGADRLRGPSPRHADWGWIPLELPSQVRVLATARPGAARAEMEARGWCSLEIEPLAEDLQRAFIRAYLGRVGRNLGRTDLERMVSAPLSRHALFLRLLLQELRAVGRYAELSTQIAGYLDATSLSDLYVKAFRRWERDYGAKLVRQSLALIAVCPSGISEHDLRMILASPDEPLESARWSPLLASAEADLSPRRGFLALTNDHVSRAVLHEYLQPEDELTARYLVASLYRRVANTHVSVVLEHGIETRHPGIRELVGEGLTEFSEIKERAFHEVPAQLARLERWDDLLQVLTSRPYLDWAFENAGVDLCRYWQQLSAHRPGAALALAEGLELSTDQRVRHCLEIADLLEEIGEYEGALRVRTKLDAKYRQDRDWSSLGKSRLRRAAILRRAGDTRVAFDADREAEALFRACKDEAGCADALASQGSDLALLHEDGSAVPKLEAAMRIFQRDGARERLAFVYDALGVVLARRGNSDRAIEYLQRAETIFREMADREGLARTLGNRAFALMSAGRLRDALKYRDEAARLRNEVAGQQGRGESDSR